MPKLYCISDIHSFYNEMRKALDEAGFDPNNENHWLISCGDHFDRGPDPDKVMKYLRSLPRKVLLRGNHEDLLVECCERGEPLSYDYSNGTVDTIYKLGNYEDGYSFYECCHRTLSKTHLFIDGMVDYFETKNYVFTHGFLPVENIDDWRNSNKSQWEEARWLNGMQMAHYGNTIDKCVVVGHFHTSWGRAKFEKKPEFGPDADFSPYYYKDKLIAIDACTAYSGKANVLVLEDEFI